MYHNQVWASQILNAKGSWDVVNVDYGSTHGAPSLIQLSPTIASRDMGIPEAHRPRLQRTQDNIDSQQHAGDGEHASSKLPAMTHLGTFVFRCSHSRIL